VYVGEKGGKLAFMAEDSGLFDECYSVQAGKYRRYANDGFLTKLLDIKTNLLNIRDACRFAMGLVQAKKLMKRLRPDAVLLKGGFVCVPLSMAASKTEAFIVTHDSDAVPGLSNRFAARYADVICVGMPPDNYRYPVAKMLYTGLPIDERYRSYSSHETRFLKEKLGVAPEDKVVLVLGGSLGARRLNMWCSKAFDNLAPQIKNLKGIIIYGKGNQSQVKQLRKQLKHPDQIQFLEFSTELYHLMAIADIVITRTGATTMAEAAAVKRATITIPSPDLSGGHQVKNAKILSRAKATIYIPEDEITGKGRDGEILAKAIGELLHDATKASSLGKNLHDFYPKKPATLLLADLLITQKMSPHKGQGAE